MDLPERTETLVARAQQGDATAFNEIVKACRSRLGSVVASRMGQHLRERLEPEDILQEVLLRAFKSIRRFQWQAEETFFGPYTCGIDPRGDSMYCEHSSCQ